jgi:hypothetical protein
VLLPTRQRLATPASPGTRRQPVQFFRRDPIARLRESHRLETGFLPDSVVNKAQKVTAAIGVVIPGILTVERDGDVSTFRDFHDSANEIFGCVFRRAVHVVKSDQVRDRAIAKEYGHTIALKRLIQPPPLSVVQVHPGFRKDAFICGHPAKAHGRNNRRHFIGNGAL